MLAHSQVLPVLSKVLYIIGKLQLVTGITNTFILPISDIAVSPSPALVSLPPDLAS